MGLFSSQLEKELEKLYTDMFVNTLGMNQDEAETTVKQLIIKAKDIVKQTGEDKFPSNMAELIINDPKMKPAYERRKNEGVKDEDIRWWWNLQPLERHMMLQVDEFHKMALFIKEREEGKSAEEAAMVGRKYHPFFGDSNDTTHVSGDNRLLPEELKDRINKYIEKRMLNDATQYKKDVENSSTFNALIRKEIGEGDL